MKINKNDCMEMVVYFVISMLFGGGFGLIALIVHEDNDRCHYYHEEWNNEDLTRGCIAIAAGTIIRLLLGYDI